MVSIGRSSVAGEFCVDMRSTSLGVFEFFENENAAAFTHDKTGTILVEWAGSLFRSAVELVGIKSFFPPEHVINSTPEFLRNYAHGFCFFHTAAQAYHATSDHVHYCVERELHLLKTPI